MLCALLLLSLSFSLSLRQSLSLSLSLSAVSVALSLYLCLSLPLSFRVCLDASQGMAEGLNVLWGVRVLSECVSFVGDTVVS
jgi:hypothetical protein